MASVLRGGRDQEWINRGARDRADARFAKMLAAGAVALAFFLAIACVYFASLPHEVPVYLGKLASGAFVPYVSQAPDATEEQHLAAEWVGDWRLGLSTPQSQSARQVAALIGSDAVASQVRDYYQQVADGGWTVVPTISSVVCAADECQVDWSETYASTGKQTMQRWMVAHLTIGFDDGHVLLHENPLTNPHGMFVKVLRVFEVPVNHAH